MQEPWRREAASFVELFALTGIAVAQPIFDRLGKHATELVAGGRTRQQILAVTLMVLVVPAIAAWTIEFLVGALAPRLRRSAHVVATGTITAIIAIEAFKSQTQWGTVVLVVIGVLLGAAGGWLLWRSGLVRQFVRFLALAPIGFAALFVFSSPVTAVMFPASTATSGVTIGTPSRVVMIQLDELPLGSLLDGTGKIDATLFPNFAALASQSNWYRNTTTISSLTETSVPAIASGRIPRSEHTLPLASQYPRSIFTLLGGRYQMNVHETITHLCPERLCPSTKVAAVSHRSFGGFLADTAGDWIDFASPERAKAPDASQAFSVEATAQLVMLPFLQSLTPSTTPRLDYVHVLLPHQGWHYLDTGQDNGAAFETGQVFTAQTHAVWPDDWLGSVGRQRHLLQLEYTDRLIGQVIDQLRGIGAYDRSIIVVTADHGVSFAGGEPSRGVSAKNAPDILWVPLFIKAPGQTRGAVSDQPVQSLDILPTLADLLHVRSPWKFDGRSVFGTPRTPGEVPTMALTHNTLKPRHGSKFVMVDGVQDFATVLSRRASPYTEPPSLRLFRLGPYGPLVGTNVPARLAPAIATLRATVRDPAKFDAVDPAAPFVPWTWIAGTIGGVPAGQSIAVAVNGVVGGISQVTTHPGGFPTYWSSLPAQFFHKGHNEITLYRLDGSPSSVRFVPVQTTK